MTTTIKPEINMPVSAERTAVANADQRALLLANMTSAGTATDGALNTDKTLAQIKTLGGAGGMAYDAAKMFRDVNTETPLDVLLLDDPGTGAAAVKSILFDGTATEAGSYTVGYGNDRFGEATVTVAIGDTDEDVVDAVVTAFSSLTDCVGTVTENGSEAAQADFTYNHVGVEGNYTPLWIEGEIAGLTATVSSSTAGTGTVTMTGVLDAIAGIRYNKIILPVSFGTSEVVTLLNSRWNTVNKVMDGTAVVTGDDTKANLVTAGNLLNSKDLVYIGQKQTATTLYHGPERKENPLAVSALLAAISTLRLTQDADISSYVSSSVEPLDRIGGPALASLPYANTPITELEVLNIGFGFTVGEDGNEIDDLNDAGISVIGDNVARSGVLLDNIVTTYKTDSEGNADLSWKYLNYPETASQCREYLMNNLRASMSQSRLTTGATVGGRTMNNETTIRSKFMRFTADLAGENFALVQAGDAARQYIDDNLNISINMLTGLATCTFRLPLVTQLRAIYAPMQIVFSI